MLVIEAIDQSRNLLSEPLSDTRTFPDDSSTFFTDTELLGFLNLVQQEIQQEIIRAGEDYFITQTTISIVADTSAYDLPGDFIKMRRVQDGRFQSPIVIEPVTLNDPQFTSFPQIIQGSNGVPREYYIKGTQIVFRPTPNFTTASAVTIHYVVRTPDFASSDSTQSLTIPVQWQRAVVWGITKYALFKQQTPDNFADNEYTKALKDIRQQADGRQSQKSRSVRRVKSRSGLRGYF